MLDPPLAHRDRQRPFDPSPVGQRRDEALGRGRVAVEGDQECPVGGERHCFAVERQRARAARRLPDQRAALDGGAAKMEIGGPGDGRRWGGRRRDGRLGRGRRRRRGGRRVLRCRNAAGDDDHAKQRQEDRPPGPRPACRHAPGTASSIARVAIAALA